MYKQQDQRLTAAGARSGFTPRALQRQYVDSRPELMQQWHPTKNTNLHKPGELTLASCEKVWWQCTACPCGHAHDWQARVDHRVLLGTGCPVCAGKRPCACTSLAACRPDIARQWDSAGNDGLRPEEVTEFSNKVVQWRCDEHGQPCSWETRICDRTRRGSPSGCPKCGQASRQKNRKGRSSLPATVSASPHRKMETSSRLVMFFSVSREA